MNPVIIKIVAALLAVSLSFGAGWRVKAAFEAEHDLAIKEAADKFAKQYKESESVIAALIDSKLDKIQGKREVIHRETVKIVDRPVYSNECVDDDGLRLIEAARTAGSPSAANTTEKVQ